MRVVKGIGREGIQGDIVVVGLGRGKGEIVAFHMEA